MGQSEALVCAVEGGGGSLDAPGLLHLPEFGLVSQVGGGWGFERGLFFWVGCFYFCDLAGCVIHVVG